MLIPEEIGLQISKCGRFYESRDPC